MNLLEEAKRLDGLRTQGEWKFELERYSAKCIIGMKPLDDRWVAQFQPEFNGEDNALFSVWCANNLKVLIEVIEKQRAVLEDIASDEDSGMSVKQQRLADQDWASDALAFTEERLGK